MIRHLHWNKAPCIGFRRSTSRYHQSSILWSSSSWCYVGLIMCSIHIDESATCVNYCTTITSYVYLSLKSWTVCFMAATTVETTPGCLRLPLQEGAWGRCASRRTSMVLHCYPFFSLMQRSWDDNAKSLMYFDSLHAYFSPSNIFCFCYVLDVVHRLLRTILGVLFIPNRWNMDLLLYFCIFFFWLSWEWYKSLQWELLCYSSCIFLSIELVMNANLRQNELF
jgi:hypothetical protein